MRLHQQVIPELRQPLSSLAKLRQDVETGLCLLVHLLLGIFLLGRLEVHHARGSPHVIPALHEPVVSSRNGKIELLLDGQWLVQHEEWNLALPTDIALRLAIKIDTEQLLGKASRLINRDAITPADTGISLSLGNQFVKLVVHGVKAGLVPLSLGPFAQCTFQLCLAIHFDTPVNGPANDEMFIGRFLDVIDVLELVLPGALKQQLYLAIGKISLLALDICRHLFADDFFGEMIVFDALSLEDVHHRLPLIRCKKPGNIGHGIEHAERLGNQWLGLCVNHRNVLDERHGILIAIRQEPSVRIDGRACAQHRRELGTRCGGLRVHKNVLAVLREHGTHNMVGIAIRITSLFVADVVRIFLLVVMISHVFNSGFVELRQDICLDRLVILSKMPTDFIFLALKITKGAIHPRDRRVEISGDIVHVDGRNVGIDVHLLRQPLAYLLNKMFFHGSSFQCNTRYNRKVTRMETAPPEIPPANA